MKNSICILILTTMATFVHATAPDSVWSHDDFPIVFVVDSQSLPLGIDNNLINRNALVDSLSKWNENNSLGQMVDIEQGEVDLTGGFTWNDVNEIKFTKWESNIPNDSAAVNKSRFHVESALHPKICVPYTQYGCLLERRESDTLFNPTHFNHFIRESVPFNCNGQINANTSFRHEIGHALGIKHFGSQLMGGDLKTCEVFQVRNRDYRRLKRLYPSLDTVSINIQSPSPNQIYIVNQMMNLHAVIDPFSNQNNTQSNIIFNENDLVWSSSIDGFLGKGNNIQVSNLSGGLHEFTVTVGEPGEAIFGEGGVSVYVIDSVSEIIDANGNQVAAPFPCPRTISNQSGECLFNVKQSFSYGNCANLVTHTDTYVEDLPAGAGIGTGHPFTPYVGPFPSCNTNNPFATNYYDIQSWINDEYSPNQVNYHMRHSIHRIQGSLPSEHHYFYPVPMVEPEIYVLPIDDCDVSNVSQKCAVTVNYEDKYFLPDAGLYFRNQGETQWLKIDELATGSDGQISTGNIVGVDGVELAVFQYANDIYRADFPAPTGNPIIHAPDGMIAGPFTVKGISSDTSPVDPELLSAETSCSNNYCITLLGRYFDADASVDIRENSTSGALLKTIQGNDIYNRGVLDGLDRIHFPIQDLSLQNKLSNEGLCFFVVNSPEFSDPICITRPTTPTQPSFVGQPVGHYLFGVEDIEYTSYEVLGAPDNTLKIWGNSWKKVLYQYNVKPSTVLKFDFKSDQQEPEINGIGFIKGGESLVTENWQVFGTENWGRQEYNNYSGSGWKSYSIPIGQEFTGRVNFMVFAGDEDSHVGQNSFYRNPQLVEVDIYEEDDDYLSTNNVIGINNPWQYHDFSDDTVDWIRLVDSPLYEQLGVGRDACNNLACGIELSDVNDVDLCLQFSDGDNSSEIQCGLSNGYYTDEQLILPSDHVGPPPSLCNYRLGWYRFKLSDNTGSPSSNKSYKVKASCTFDDNPSDNQPDIYENDDIISQANNVLPVNGVKQHHNFRDDAFDAFAFPSMTSVLENLNLNLNDNCENLSCKIKVSNLVNVDLCTVVPPSGGVGPLPNCTTPISSLSGGFVGNHSNNSQCSNYEFIIPAIGINNHGHSGGPNKSYDIELICTNN